MESVLNAFKKYASEIHDILGKQPSVFNTGEEQAFIDHCYPTTPSISIDFAIMEKADNVYTIPSSFGWSDLGTWASLYAESEKGENNNVVNTGHLLTYEVENCLIRTPKEKLVVLRGLNDYIIVDEDDILLIYPKSKEQEIKGLTGEIKQIQDLKHLV